MSFSTSGSSPLTRGTLLPVLAVELRAGIIPAYAGNTLLPMHSLFPRWDHPRLRGEHKTSCASMP